MTKARILTLAIGTLVAMAGLVWAFWPEPVPVDLAEAHTAPMQVTVSAEGVTRVRDPYLVTAPISGTATRSPVQVGQQVIRDATIVAVIQPAEPALLDARARAEAEATVAEAEAAVGLAEVNLARARADLAYSEAQLRRNRELAARGTIPQRVLEDVQQMVETNRAALEAAESEMGIRRATLTRAGAALTGPDSQIGTEAALNTCCVEIAAPQSGTVLAVEQASARLVQAGTPLLTIGNLSDLEVEVDLLSTDAVAISPGARALIERWGGEGVLEAQVRRIDPRGFTRFSALGIEEQRVPVTLEFTDPPAARAGLGDAFRVFARIVVWEAEEALQVPISALFRLGGDWAVYRVVEGRTRLARVEIGARTQTEAQVLSGLAPGDMVVAYPGDRVTEGTRVVARVMQ